MPAGIKDRYKKSSYRNNPYAPVANNVRATPENNQPLGNVTVPQQTNSLYDDPMVSPMGRAAPPNLGVPDYSTVNPNNQPTNQPNENGVWVEPGTERPAYRDPIEDLNGVSVSPPTGPKLEGVDDQVEYTTSTFYEENPAPIQKPEGVNESVETVTSSFFGDEDPEDPYSDEPANVTEQGSRYDENVLKGLEGEAADVTSARNRADRANKYQSYADNKSFSESLASEGIMPGTARYNRMLDKNRAQTNQANLARDNDVNQLGRDYYRDAMDQARGVEEKKYGYKRDDVADERYADETAYGRGRDDVADERYADETAYNREQDEYYKDQTEKLQTTRQAEDFINTQPQKIQNILSPFIINGDMEGFRAKVQEMYKDGTLQGDYLPATSNQAGMDEAEDYYSTLYPKGNMSDAEWRNIGIDSDGDGQNDTSIGKQIQKRFQELDEAARDPLKDADYEGDKTDSKRVLNDAIQSGSEVTDQMVTSGMDPVSIGEIPTYVADIDDKIGTYMNINGKAIKIIGSGTYTREGLSKQNEYVKIEYPVGSGTFYYKDNGGGGISQWFSDKPVDDADIGAYNTQIDNPLQ